jgi:hypothetical protein
LSKQCDKKIAHLKNKIVFFSTFDEYIVYFTYFWDFIIDKIPVMNGLSLVNWIYENYKNKSIEFEKPFQDVKYKHL